MANFGYETIGGSSYEISFDATHEYVYGSVFTVSESGIANSMTVALKRAVAGSNNIKCAIYKHSDLSLVGVTEQILTSLTATFAWKTFNFIGAPALVAGTAYVLVVWADWTINSISIAYTYVEGSTFGHRHNKVYDGFPDPLVPTHSAYKCSIYCTYTPSGVAVKQPLMDGFVFID